MGAVENMPARLLFYLPLFCISLLFCGCGPKVKIEPEYAGSKSRIVAVLPSRAGAIQREKVGLVEQALVRELRTSGYLVLDPEIVNDVCRDYKCSDYLRLHERYGVKGFFILEITSISRNNFFAGYYNQLSGKLELLNTAGRKLLSVQHTERERGGVVFESGQVVQGVISQIRNASDAAQQRLGEKFVMTLLQQVPKADENQSDLERASLVEINSVKLTKVEPEVVRVCAVGSEDSLAYFKLLRHKARLRETTAGTYCGIFRLAEIDKELNSAGVELRSAFGSSRRRPLAAAWRASMKDYANRGEKN